MRTDALTRAVAIVGACLWCLAGCPSSGSHSRQDAGSPDGSLASDAGDAGDAGGLPGGDGGLVPLTAVLVNEQFDVADHMRASREMQVSGEPFAQLLGYNLSGFNRTLSITDQYFDGGVWRTDPLGYALAIESYEYSKQPMNNLSFESGAGLSLMYGPVLNPQQQSGDGGFGLLLTRFQQFALESNSGGGGTGSLITSPAPNDNPLNYYGWPGLWPIFAEFSSFQPAINPNPGLINTCTFSGTVGAFSYGGGGPISASTAVANYECDYNSLNLPNRARQVSMTLDPAGMGYATWKQGLWTINYWGTLQDTGGNPITVVAPGDMAQVGQPGNSVVGFFQSGTNAAGPTYDAGLPGVYLGDIPMEGWQGLTMLEEIDNKAQFLLSSLLSSDGTSLTGVSSLQAATDYAYDTAPLLYFPASVSVTEVSTAPSTKLADKFFPQPTAFAIANGQSLLQSLSGLIGGFGEAFATTDSNNAQVGGSVPFLATFDGDPFPMDDGLPDGQSTLHDRALGVLKIALVDLDRLHLNASAKVLVDASNVAGSTVTQGTTVTTVELTEAILALRNAFRALNGTLQLYSNDTPDTQGVPSVLDGTPLGGASYSGTLSNHLLQLITLEANFLSTELISSSGAVANGYDVATGTADPSPTDLAAEGAAIRGLLEAYLATSNESYRLEAIAVYQDLESRFWMSDVMAFRTTAGVDDPLKFTPARFGMLWGALRQYYKLVASQASRAPEGAEVLQRIKRTFKLVINGWNDLNQDDQIQYPAECMATGIEMGERALTGELGHPGDDGDREHDCIREISYVSLPAALGAELDLSRH